jgi:hypothetical protein
MQIFFLVLTFFSIAAFQDCDGDRNAPQQRSSETVKAADNGLEVEFTILRPEIKTGDEFLAKAVFTNRSNRNIRLNALFLEFGPILLQTRHDDGTEVMRTSPPFPPEDDGEEARIKLAPGESASFQYRGLDLFGEELKDGKYSVRFRHENKVTKYGDWAGKLETDWVGFKVNSKLDAVGVAPQAGE